MVTPQQLTMWGDTIKGYVKPDMMIVVDRSSPGFIRRYVIRAIYDEKPDGSHSCRVSTVQRNGWINGDTMTTINFEGCELERADRVCELNQRAAKRR